MVNGVPAKQALERTADSLGPLELFVAEGEVFGSEGVVVGMQDQPAGEPLPVTHLRDVDDQRPPDGLVVAA